MRLTGRFLPTFAAVASASFMVSAVTSFEIIGTLNVRWLILTALFIYLIAARQLLTGMTNVFGATLGLYIMWCAATVLWSLEPALSAAKVASLALVTTAFISAGAVAGMTQPLGRMFDFLAPVTFLALFAGLIGGSDGRAPGSPDEIELYSGAINGPNMFGLLQAVATPLALWRIYIGRGNSAARLLWLAVLGLHVVFLFYSGSRASILTLIVISSAFLIAVDLRAWLASLAVVAALLMAVVSFAPDLASDLEYRFVYKGATAEQGALHSREEVWQDSMDAARAGSLFGLGYGVSLGEGTTVGSAGAGGYAREKGNSQLGIVEETGLVGLALYALLLMGLVFETTSTIAEGRNAPPTRVAASLLLGLIGGMLVNSGFEAWWGAPGAPEFPLFFLSCGVAVGFAYRNRHALADRPSAMATQRADTVRQAGKPL